MKQYALVGLVVPTKEATGFDQGSKEADVYCHQKHIQLQ